MPSSGVFPRTRRIRRRAEFVRAQRGGVAGRTRHAVLLAFDRGDAEAARIGIAASRKLGSAVVRNRLKRRVREWFRRRALPAGLDLVVIPTAAAADAPAQAFWRSLDEAAEKALARACRPGPCTSS